MNELSQEIINRCCQQDASAFATVVQTLERPLFAYVYRFTAGESNLTDPEDMVQDIFVKVWNGLPGLKANSPSAFQAWVFRIARNHLISILRKHRPDMIRDNDEGDGLFGRIPDEKPTPRESAQNQQIESNVAEAISSLNEKLRTAFILRYYEDLSYGEISAILECSEGTVKSRISRARAILSEQLRDHLKN